MAELLREGRFAELDVEHLAEEIESLGRNHAFSVQSQLRRMLLHLIKMRIQPERTGSSWRRSITDSRNRMERRLTDSPSLRRKLESELERIYRRAVSDALYETNLTERAAELDIPAECPYTLDELLAPDPGALWPR
jgi:hypothetical protein